MAKAEDLDRARATYQKTRQIWFAGGILDAFERLAIVTVAAGLRYFAFLNHLTPQSRKIASQLFSNLGFHTRVLHARFDLDVKMRTISQATENAYKSYKSRNERLFGLGIWSNNGLEPFTQNVTITNLGSLLGYPECCVKMDLQTKQHDNRLFLRALVNEVGDDPDKVTWGLRRQCAVSKASYSHLRKWEKRYKLTLARFPFALHAACDECLRSPTSPTAKLSKSYESLAKSISEELHFLVRWASHIGSGGLN